jgi:pyruvate/2-oxoglutarate dehydrogenase complex dihydrolipoamide acyltransferase (E2) component
MMRTRFVLLAAFVFAAGHVYAQTAPRPPQPAPAAPAAPPAPAVNAPAPPPPPPPPPAPPAPPTPRQAINIKVDLNITEDGAGGPLIKKSVSAVAGDGFNGSVREMSAATPPTNFIPLNLDAYPTILPSGKIRLQCSIQYQSAQNRDPGNRATDIKQNFVVILDSGKPLVVTQATDPVSDRRVTVEVTATILK